MSSMTSSGEHSTKEELISWFDDVAEKAESIQTQILHQIIKDNHSVEYLKRYLGDIDVSQMETSALESLYASAVPLASHADFEPYIQRIANGETSNLLTREPITTLSLSSGTTEGRQKYVPFTRHSSKTTLQISKLAAAYRSRVYPTKEGGKILEFIYSGQRSKTQGGVTIGLATTHVYASEEFKIRQAQTKCFTCSPEQVISSGDYKQSTYCHLLLGLHFSDQIEVISSTFAYTLVQAFRSFEDSWRDICSDISEGGLSPIITIPTMREAVLEIVGRRADPGFARWVWSKCEELERNDWFGLVPALWPNAKYAYSIMTGSMELYLSKLRHYVGDELPLVSGDYGSSESWIGANIDPFFRPERVSFVVVPTFAYFEFVPLRRQNVSNVEFANNANDCDFEEDDPVRLSNVKMGQEYEVVLTTFTGLYRYRLGDVVEVAGFHKNTPKLNFICRRKLILTINIDKNTERDLLFVVEKCSQALRESKAELVDFTSHADVSNTPGHYIIYWEIKGEADNNESLLNECCTKMDASFVDYGYITARRNSSIGPLELCIVERGTFMKIMEHFLENGAGLSQFKTPRCTNNPLMLRILDECAVKRFFSTAYAD